jgi:hypothetical protein
MGTTPEIIKRSQLAEYINVTPEGTTPSWERIGFGVEGKATDYSPEIDERQFIDEDSPNSAIKSYNAKSEFDISAAKNSPVFTFLDNLRVTRATYAAAETDYLEVRLYAPEVSPANTFAATQYKVAVAVSNIGDAAADPLTLTATINGKGDPVQGTFDYATKTFTPNAA